MNQNRYANFHLDESVMHYDGNITDLNVGDVVAVITDLHGTDKNNNPYTIPAGGWFSDSVVMIMSSPDSNGNIKLDDGTPNSPITLTNLTGNEFEDTNFINKWAFKPFEVADKLYNVATDTTSNIIDDIQATSKTITNLFSGNWLVYVIIAAIILGAIMLYHKTQ